MFKKLLLTVIIIIFGLSSVFAGTKRESAGIPEYMKIDFYQKYPHLIPDKLFKKVKYKEIPSEILKIKPEKTRFLSDDGIEIINISQQANWSNAQTETWIAINPTNPDNLIATSNDNHFLSGVDGWRMGAFWSKDGGKTWTQNPTNSNDGVIFDVGSRGTIFDPGISFNTKGEAFYCFGFTMTTYDGSESHKNKNAVIVQKTTDGGESWDKTWNDGLPLSPVAYALSATNNPFHDRYTLAIDQNESSPHKDNIYVSWQRFIIDPAPVISRSTDGGKTWSSPYKLEDHYSTQAPMPAVGPNGEVYVAWIHGLSGNRSQALVSRSTNGGQSFATPVVAQEVISIGDRDASSGRFVLNDKQKMRVSSPPQIAVDRSGGEYSGNVYVVQAGRDSEGKYGVFMSRSEDQSNSWKKQLRVDVNQLRNDMFFPSITVDPITGLIAILYYSSQNDANNQGVDAYVAVSDDAGDTWSHIRVSPYTAYLNRYQTILPQGTGNFYWGDYTSIASYNDHIYPLFWLPSKESNYDYGTNDLFTALLSPVPKGIENLAAENLIADVIEVKLTWENPLTNLFGNDLTDYTILLSRDGSNIAELSAGTSEYVDSDVEDGRTYRYEIKIKDSKGRLSESKYVMIDAGGSITPLRPYGITVNPNTNGFEIAFTVSDTMIDGTEFRDFDRVDIIIPSTDFVQEVKTLDGNNSASVQVDIETDIFYEVYLQTFSKRGGQSKRTETIVAFAGDIRQTLSENFDNAESIIPIYTKGSWSVTNEVASSAPNSITDSPFEKYEKDLGSSTSSIRLVPVQIGDMTSLTFDFMALVANQPGDQAEVNVYELNGERRILKWFNRSISDKFGDDVENSEWEQLSLDVSEFAGKTVMFEFALQSNAFLEDYGFYVDNIRLDNSPVSVLDKFVNTDISLEISPNPAVDNGNLKIGVSDPGNISIEMYDVLGHRVMTIDNDYITPGLHNYDIDLNRFANGSYMIKVSINGKIKSIPVIVNK
jgi:hypothetical protein